MTSDPAEKQPQKCQVSAWLRPGFSGQPASVSLKTPPALDSIALKESRHLSQASFQELGTGLQAWGWGLLCVDGIQRN